MSQIMATNDDFLCFEHFIDELLGYYYEYANVENLAMFLNLNFYDYDIRKMFVLMEGNYSLLLILQFIDSVDSDIEIYNRLTQLSYTELLFLTYPINSTNHWNRKLPQKIKSDVHFLSKSFTNILHGIYIVGTDSRLNFIPKDGID